jgi:hypothetical protein
VARFDHNPITGESLGLLIEEQRTNLLERSEEFDNAYWTKTASSVSSNSVIAPDGNLAGDVYIPSTASADHFLFGSVTLTAVAHTFTIYAKNYGQSVLKIGIGVPGTPVANFNLLTGAVGTTSGGATASIQSVGNGWYRCSVGFTGTAGSILVVIRSGTTDNFTNSYVSDGFNGVAIWGAQLEAGAFPTSYIPTVAAQVTRAADAASMTGANFSSWYRADEGTLYAETTLNARSSDLLAGGLGLGQNQIFFSPTSATAARFRVRNNGADQALITSTIVNIAGGSAKQCAAYKTDDFAFSANGNVAGTDTSGTVPIVDRLNIGFENLNNGYCNTTIRKLAYYPIRATNAQLQALTQN